MSLSRLSDHKPRKLKSRAYQFVADDRARRAYECLKCRAKITVTASMVSDWFDVDKLAGPCCPVCRTGGSNMFEVSLEDDF